jgi:hypothetical protein
MITQADSVDPCHRARGVEKVAYSQPVTGLWASETAYGPRRAEPCR